VFVGGIPTATAFEGVAQLAIDFDHAVNQQTLDSPRKVIPVLFEQRRPASLLDVGCGTGTWLQVARAFGIEDILGVDGVDIAAGQLLIPAEAFRVVDLRSCWNLERKFDAALCLEVAEHLDRSAGKLLIEMLTRHADEIVFSAACPGQPGQHHINCQWPGYWQEMFNGCGFSCSDAIRWKIWEDPDVDVWYRQNMFVATRDAGAGTEKRLKAVVHPDLIEHLVYAGTATVATQRVKSVEEGVMPVMWYATSAIRALAAKVRRRFIAA
jgi:SAM-dependent methyltransferase